MSSFEGVPEIVGSNTARANAAKGRANEMDWVVHAETGPDTVSSEEAKAQAEQADRDGKISALDYDLHVLNSMI